MRRPSLRAWSVGLVGAFLLGGGPVAHAAEPASALAPRRVVVPPRLVKFVEAPFPESELAAEKSAAVTLQIAIKDTGEVALVSVLGSAGPAFDEAALAAARQFVFEPATADGKPIPVRITYRYEFTWTQALVKRTTSDFSGLVKDRIGKKPAAGIKVALDTGAFTVTDAEGRFDFKDLPPGAHVVTLSGERLTNIATSETLEPGKKLDATYEIDRQAEKLAGEDVDDLEIVVTAPRLDKQVVATEVAADQARKVPGTQGDVLKVVEDLPGVARSAVGSGALIVWGSSPQDTRVYVDGVLVPRLYHDGGYRSIMQSDMVRSVELVPGGYGVAYGGGLGGLVTVQLAKLDDHGFHGAVSADTFDAAASIRDDVTDRLHVQIGGRKSYLDAVVGAFTSQNVGTIVPIPKYYDGQARVSYDLGEHETISLGGLLSSDSTSTTVLSPDPSLTNTQTTGLDFGRIFARYEKHEADGATILVIPSWGKDVSTQSTVFGGVPSSLHDDASVFGLRSSWRGPLAKFLTATVGVDADVRASTISRVGSLGSPPREGDIYVFGEPPSGQLDADGWKTVVASVAPFLEADLAPFADRLHIIPGVRFDPYVITTSRLVPQVGDVPSVGFEQEVTVAEPRLAVHYTVTPRVGIKAAVGLYHEPPSGEDLSAVFGTPKLGLSQAEHYVLGTTVAVTKSLDVEVTGFLSESQDLVVRSSAPSPLLANALTQDGIGRSYGAQVLIRQQKVGRFFGWISYTLMQSQRQDHPDLPWRLFDYDQTNVFTALGSYDLGLGFEVGARFRYATGFPRTPVTGAYYDSMTDSYQPEFGAQNSIRIPAFYAIDVRVSKHLKLGKTDGEIYIDVQNVTDHQNAEEIVYTPTYSRPGYITGLPILPVVGARWSW
jgi:TonB family protein